MAESQAHMDYVSLVEQYVLNKIPYQQRGFVFVDTPLSAYKPPVIGNYRPDVYFQHNNSLIIGEAKTVKDYETKHSKEQYVTYLKECQKFQGESLLVLCSSWTVSFSYRTLIKHIKRQNRFDTKVIIISENGIPEIII